MKNIVLKILSLFATILNVIFKILLCLFVTAFVGYWVLIFDLLPVIAKLRAFDFQMLFYAVFSIFMIIGVWLISFMKTKNVVKLIYATLLIIWFFVPKILPSVMEQINIDSCVDTGICAEGIKFGKDVVSKDYGLKQGKTWREDKKSCDMRAASNPNIKQK